MNIEKYKSHIIVGLVCTGLTFAGCWYFMSYRNADALKTGEKFMPAKEMEEYLDSIQYPYKNDRSVVNAINGYFDGCVDKYTFYYEDTSEEDDVTLYVNSSGTAVASGFQIAQADDGNILLTEIKTGLAADKQGLKVGDEISAIDGVSVAEMGYDNIANKMLGKQDTKVVFKVLRGKKEFEMQFVRDHEYINGAYFEKKDDIGYIRITHFDQLMQGQLDQTSRSAKDYSKLIVDLRDNPGGDGDIIVNFSTRFGGYSKVVKHYYSGSDEIHEKSGSGEWKDKEIVLLVNEKTASAAEILTASLKQSLNVTIVGTNTLGKGIFQEDVDIGNGGHLHYTAGTYTVGDWECYQGVGIAPDVEVPMDRELIGTDDDIQLKKALELLD